jgi:hypothetical protein
MTRSIQREVVEEAGLGDTFHCRMAKDFRISPGGIDFVAYTFRVFVTDQKDGTSTVEVIRRNGDIVGSEANVPPYLVFVAVQNIYHDWQKDLYARVAKTTREACLRLRRQRFDISLPRS